MDSSDISDIIGDISNLTPIIVISYNNHKYVSNTIKQLLKLDENLRSSIIVMDNNSDATDTIAYLHTLKDIKVIRNKTNDGPWINDKCNSHIYRLLPNRFILTDPDLQFHPDMPKNFIKTLSALADMYDAAKVGLALDISDSDKMFKGEYFGGKSIKDWEAFAWKSKIGCFRDNEIYDATIDTTFALVSKSGSINIRIAGSYTAKHIPWYVDNSIYTFRELFLYYTKSKHSSIGKLFFKRLSELGILETSHNGTPLLFDSKVDNNGHFWGQIFPKWEPETFGVFDKHLSPDKDFLDIGAWIGTTCMYAATKSRHVIAVEADPISASSLRRNIELNNKNITVVEQAIYNKDDDTIVFGKNRYMAASKWNDSTSQIVSPEQANADDIKVKTITVATLIERHNLSNLSLIKVDIEGGEEYILNDLFQIHEKLNVPMYVSFHYSWWNNKDLHRFKGLSPAHIKQIQSTPFCSILF
jgi:FkbM family methyltransferase